MVDKGVKLTTKTKCSLIKNKIPPKYGERVSFMDESSVSEFVCASSAPLGAVFEAVRGLVEGSDNNKMLEIIKQGGKIIRVDLAMLKSQQKKISMIVVTY